MTVANAFERTSRLTHRTATAARHRGIQFLRRTCLGGAMAASIFAAGEAAGQITLPPNLTIGMETITPGLLEGRLDGAFEENAPNSGSGGVVLSPLKAYTNQQPPWGMNETWVYTGQMFFPDNGAMDGQSQFSLAEHIDDNVLLRIDGVQVLRNTAWDVATTTGPLTLPAGWHDVDFRFAHGGGGSGPSGGAGNGGANGWTLDFGFGVDFTTPIEGDLNRANYAKVEDPGNASVLRVLTFNTDTSRDNQNVNVTADATLNVLQGRTVPMGTLTVANGVTFTARSPGGPTTFTETNIGATATFDVTAGTIVGGPLKSGGAVTTITKTGEGTFRASTRAGANLASNPVVNVNGGTLDIAVAGGSTSVGTGPFNLNGGTLAISNDSLVPSGPGLFGTTGQWYLDDNVFDPLVSQDSTNGFGWSGLDSKAQLDSKLSARTPLATVPVNLPINFPVGDANPANGGENDNAGAVFNIQGANLGVGVNGSGTNAEWAARFTGKLNVTTAGATPFTLLANDGAVLFLDMDLGPGQNWQKVVDSNRYSTTGGAVFGGYVSGQAGAIDGGFNPDAAAPAIAQPAVPNLQVGQYDYIVGTFNKGENEYGIELFWTPPDGTRQLVPLATGGPINFTHTVNVSGNSGLTLNSPTTMPNILLNDGSSLTVSGQPLTSTQTTIDGTAQINMNAQVNLGTIVPATAGQPWTFIKGGSRSFTASGPAFAGLSSAHGVGVGGGRLVVQGAKGANPTSIGSAKIVLAGGTFVADSGVAETPGAANTLTEYWYHTNGNIPETSIEPPDGPGGLLRMVPTGTMPLTESLVQFGDDPGSGDTVDIGARWGRVDQVAAGWFGEWTFSGGAVHGNQYTFASKSDDGSAIWIDLDGDGRFEGGGRRVNDGTTPNEMVLDNNDYQGDEAFSSLRTIPDGTYRVFLGWYEGGGGATSSFKWQRGDGSWAGNNVGNYDGSATLIPIDPTVSTVAASRGRSYDLNADTGNASFQGNAIEVLGEVTTLEANGASKFGPMTFLNTGTVNVVGSKTTIASVTTANGTGTLNNTLGAGNFILGDVGASAGATTVLEGSQAAVTGAITGEGTVRIDARNTVEFSKSGAAATGSPSLIIGRDAVANFTPGSGNTFAAAAVTAIDHSGTIRATNGITDLSGAVVTTTIVPGTIVSAGMSHIVGDFYTAAEVGLPMNGAPNSANTFGWNGLDTKAAFDAALAGKTPVATRNIVGLEINFPRGNGSLVDGGTNDEPGEIFNMDGANLNVPLRGDQDFVVRFTGKLNITTAGPTAFGYFGNDGGVIFLDLDQGPGTNWVKVADHNRMTGTGGGNSSEHGTIPGSGGDPGTPAIPQTPAPNLSVGTYDFVVGMFNTREADDDTPEAGIELFWDPAGPDGRSIIPLGEVILPTVVQVDSGATLRLGAVRNVTSVNIDANGKLELHGPASKIAAGALSIAGTLTAPTATLDVTDSGIVLDYPDAGPNPAADVRSRIIAGRGAPGLIGSWDGKGITSSTSAAAPDQTSVGYAVNGDMPLGPVATYGGLPVDASSVIIRHTRTGDANLDGVVNDDDVTIVGAMYAPGVPNANWGNGDFDYNGFVDDDDVTLLGALYDPSATPIPAAPAAAGGVAAVPEPATWLMLTLGGLGAGLIGWRRRRQR